jgi:FAD/FMN-containing dehydrogenase
MDVFWLRDADREANVTWHQEFMAFMAPYGNGHSYQNYPSRYQQDWRWAYFGPYLPTLVRVKDKYDPKNLFRYAQTISPEPGGASQREYAAVLFAETDIERDAAS